MPDDVPEGMEVNRRAQPGLVKSNGTAWEIVVPYPDTCSKIIPLKGHPKSI